MDEALNYVRAGDTLVVWRLDRLGRSLKHLIETIQQLDTRHIGFKSLTENIDTTTSGGKLIFHIFGALMAARARGRKGGRPKVLTGKQLSIALDLYEKRHPIAEICRTLKISKATLYRSIKIGDRDQQYGSSR